VIIVAEDVWSVHKYCAILSTLESHVYRNNRPAMRAGAVQLAGVGIALSVYSTVTKLFNVPLLSVATSSVATAYGEHGGQKLCMLLCTACDDAHHEMHVDSLRSAFVS